MLPIHQPCPWLRHNTGTTTKHDISPGCQLLFIPVLQPGYRSRDKCVKTFCPDSYRPGTNVIFHKQKKNSSSAHVGPGSSTHAGSFSQSQNQMQSQNQIQSQNQSQPQKIHSQINPNHIYIFEKEKRKKTKPGKAAAGGSWPPAAPPAGAG